MRNELALSLEEFGLSRYEAKVYLALLDKGPLSATELAYYGVPRTKVYSTLTKLTKKGLAITSQDKPLVFTAIAPDDAFCELLSAQESKVTVMKNMITKLKKIREGNKPYGSEERRYLILGPNSVLNTMNELILDAKEIACIVDSGGT